MCTCVGVPNANTECLMLPTLINKSISTVIMSDFETLKVCLLAQKSLCSDFVQQYPCKAVLT